MAGDWGARVENALAHAAVGLVAAAFGVWAGVRVHEAQIEEIKERLTRIEDKVDRLIERQMR